MPVLNYLRKWKLNTAKGYSMPEILATVLIIGVISAIPLVSKSWYEDSLRNATDRTTNVLKQARMRAIANTSAYRITPNPDAPTTQFKVEIAKTRGCDTTTKLTAAATTTDTQLSVVSAQGFVVGDAVKVGSDSQNNEIIATDSTSITLGQSLGSSQATNTVVELVNNWLNDFNFTEEDVSLPKDTQMSADLSDWTLCYNSRGLASLYNASGEINSNLVLTITTKANSESNTITIFPGGTYQIGN